MFVMSTIGLDPFASQSRIAFDVEPMVRLIRIACQDPGQLTGDHIQALGVRIAQDPASLTKYLSQTLCEVRDLAEIAMSVRPLLKHIFDISHQP
jgi:hypothetical protein